MNVKEIKPYQVTNSKKRKFASKTSEGFVYQTLRPGSKKVKKPISHPNVTQTKQDCQPIPLQCDQSEAGPVNHTRQNYTNVDLALERDHMHQISQNTHQRDNNTCQKDHNMHQKDYNMHQKDHNMHQRDSPEYQLFVPTSKDVHLEDLTPKAIHQRGPSSFPEQMFESNNFFTPSQSRHGGNHHFETSSSSTSKGRQNGQDVTSTSSFCPKSQNDLTSGSSFWPKGQNSLTFSSSFCPRGQNDFTPDSSVFPLSDQLSQDTNPYSKSNYHQNSTPGDYYSEVVACNKRLERTMARCSSAASPTDISSSGSPNVSPYTPNTTSTWFYRNETSRHSPTTIYTDWAHNSSRYSQTNENNSRHSYTNENSSRHGYTNENSSRNGYTNENSSRHGYTNENSSRNGYTNENSSRYSPANTNWFETNQNRRVIQTYENSSRYSHTNENNSRHSHTTENNARYGPAPTNWFETDQNRIIQTRNEDCNSEVDQTGWIESIDATVSVYNPEFPPLNLFSNTDPNQSDPNQIEKNRRNNNVNVLNDNAIERNHINMRDDPYANGSWKSTGIDITGNQNRQNLRDAIRENRQGVPYPANNRDIIPPHSSDSSDFLFHPKRTKRNKDDFQQIGRCDYYSVLNSSFCTEKRSSASHGNRFTSCSDENNNVQDFATPSQDDHEDVERFYNDNGEQVNSDIVEQLNGKQVELYDDGCPTEMSAIFETSSDSTDLNNNEIPKDNYLNVSESRSSYAKSNCETQQTSESDHGVNLDAFTRCPTQQNGGRGNTPDEERNEKYLRLLSPEFSPNFGRKNGNARTVGNEISGERNLGDVFTSPSTVGRENEFDSPPLQTHTDQILTESPVVSASSTTSASRHYSALYFAKPTFQSPLVRRKLNREPVLSETSNFDFGPGAGADFSTRKTTRPDTPSPSSFLTTPTVAAPSFPFLTPTPTKKFLTYMTSSSTSSKLTRSGGELTKNKILYAGKTSSKSRSATSSSTDQHIRSSTSDLRTPRTKTRTQRTPGSSSSTQTEQSNVIMAITEGRGQARGEVGIAAIDTKHPKLVLCQISDSPTYIHTLTKIHVLNPVQIIMPNTITENVEYNKLFNLIKDKFEHIELTSVLRRYFSDSQGLDYIRKTCLPEYNVLLLVLHKFYALSATCALIKYVEFVQNIIFLSRSLQVQYQASENVTFIDFETSQKLELVLSQSNKLKSKCNLYGVLNHCVTMGGQRKLRSTILQPSCNSRVIKQRLDCVSELIENPRILCEIQTSLKKFSDIERLLSLCYEPTSLNKDSKKHFEQQINLTLLLKSALESLPPLIQTLAECHHPLFKSMKENFSDPRFKSILSLIDDTIRTDAAPVKGYASSQMQRCFAVKENINSLLDVARTVYSEIVDDIYNKAREMSQEYDLPLRVCNSSSRAFHLSYATRKTFKLADLPPLFINVQLNKSRTLVTMTTEEIIFMNQRIKSALDEVHSMTNLIIRDLLKKAHEHMSCIYKLCEHIAELDLIVSLAQVSSSNNYVQPSFGSKMNVKNARHPLLDFILPSEPVANDILCTRWKNFHIITGPNMSGKSVYIKQVALLQIMAQVGCYVPASLAEFRLADHIYTRIGFNDSIECNASTFALEMKEIAHIIQFLTPRSLILVDELCRGTSIDEGTSLAWAICESLIQTKAFVFFTTHFLLLAQLENLYPNVTNYHLEAKYKDSDQKSGVVYTHKLLPGVTCIEHYGLKLAEKTGLPRSIIGEAQTLAARLLREKQTDLDRELTEKADNTNEELIVKLLDHYENGTLNIDTVKTILGPFQEHANVQSLEDFEDRDASELRRNDGNSEERIQRNIEFDSNSGTRDDEQDDENSKEKMQRNREYNTNSGERNEEYQYNSNNVECNDTNGDGDQEERIHSKYGDYTNSGSRDVDDDNDNDEEENEQEPNSEERIDSNYTDNNTNSHPRNRNHTDHVNRSHGDNNTRRNAQEENEQPNREERMESNYAKNQTNRNPRNYDDNQYNRHNMEYVNRSNDREVNEQELNSKERIKSNYDEYTNSNPRDGDQYNRNNIEYDDRSNAEEENDQETNSEEKIDSNYAGNKKNRDPRDINENDSNPVDEVKERKGYQEQNNEEIIQKHSKDQYTNCEGRKDDTEQYKSRKNGCQDGAQDEEYKGTGPGPDTRGQENSEETQQINQGENNNYDRSNDQEENDNCINNNYTVEKDSKSQNNINDQNEHISELNISESHENNAEMENKTYADPQEHNGNVCEDRQNREKHKKDSINEKIYHNNHLKNVSQDAVKTDSRNVKTDLNNHLTKVCVTQDLVDHQLNESNLTQNAACIDERKQLDNKCEIAHAPNKIMTNTSEKADTEKLNEKFNEGINDHDRHTKSIDFNGINTSLGKSASSYGSDGCTSAFEAGGESWPKKKKFVVKHSVVFKK
ncbi:hypothetical protein M8J77_010482 [Diaphorina citri]|nr:hypothetical protein M8J77_010482 [Diaphorina citri]